MSDRLSTLDASFLFAEDRTTAMHVGGVMTFEQPAAGPFDVAAFTALIEERLHLVPRYRQKVRTVPGGLGLPVWVDDPEFDIDFHVRHSALAAPGSRRCCASWWAVSWCASSTAAGRCGRSTSSRGSPTAVSPWSPRPTTRWSTGSPRWTSGRPCSTSPRSRG